MGRLIDADEYEKRIKPYDTEDAMDKALYNFAHDHLVTTPTAQPQRKGRWVQISPAKIYECSICGKNVMTSDIDAYDFCHGCGADMRGEQG